jgi:hypothetical protein
VAIQEKTMRLAIGSMAFRRQVRRRRPDSSHSTGAYFRAAVLAAGKLGPSVRCAARHDPVLLGEAHQRRAGVSEIDLGLAPVRPFSPNFSLDRSGHVELERLAGPINRTSADEGRPGRPDAALAEPREERREGLIDGGGHALRHLTPDAELALGWTPLDPGFVLDTSRALGSQVRLLGQDRS